MTVKWSALALEKWQAIADYIFSEFGISGLMEYDEPWVHISWKTTGNRCQAIGNYEAK